MLAIVWFICSVSIALIGTLHRFDVLSLQPHNTTSLFNVASTAFFVNFTSHPLSHSCGNAKRLCTSPGNRYAVRACGGSCGRLSIRLAIVVMIVPLGRVIVLGV